MRQGRRSERAFSSCWPAVGRNLVHRNAQNPAYSSIRHLLRVQCQGEFFRTRGLKFCLSCNKVGRVTFPGSSQACGRRICFGNRNRPLFSPCDLARLLVQSKCTYTYLLCLGMVIHASLSRLYLLVVYQWRPFYRESLYVKRTLGAYGDTSEPCGFLKVGELGCRVSNHGPQRVASAGRLRLDYSKRSLQCPRGPGRHFVMKP